MKFNNILFPVDFSNCSRALNPEVEYLANRFNSDVTLLHVFEVPFTWYGSGEAPLMSAECLQTYLKDVRQRLQQYPINVPSGRLHRVIAEGDAAWHVKTFAQDNHIDLIMIGTHGYGTVRRLLLGSVAMKVLHDVLGPVWTHSAEKATNGTAFHGIKNVVCALEINDEAVPLLRFVSNLANQFDASVRLIHSVPDDASRPYRYFDTDLHRFLVKLADEEIAKLQSRAGTYFNVDLVENPIGQATALAAAQQQADLIIIGRGKTQDAFGTLRTHTYDIIREAHCPVLSYCSPLAETEHKLTASELVTHQMLTAI